MGVCGAGNGDYFQSIGLQLLEDILGKDDWTYENSASPMKLDSWILLQTRNPIPEPPSQPRY
jgi:hypothetical protein